MKVELTLQQFKRLRNLSPESWRALDTLLEDGGTGNFTPDLHQLGILGLLKKIGPMCAVKFLVDGFMPAAIKQKKRNSNELSMYLSIWTKITGKSVIHPKDFAAIKRFSNSYSPDEFKAMVAEWHRVRYQDNTFSVATFWTIRGRYSNKVEKEDASEFEGA